MNPPVAGAGRGDQSLAATYSRQVWWQRAGAGYFADLPVSQPDVFEWTAHRDARRGDVVLMYANGDQTFSAVGRLLCDPVEADRGDGGLWTYLQIMAARHPLPRSRTGLGPRQGEFTNLSSKPEDAAAILAAWRRSDPDLVDRVQRWLHGPLPRGPRWDIAELRWAERTAVPRRDRRPGGELELQDRIRELLVESKIAREIEPERDGVDIRDSFSLPDPYGPQYADLVLARPTRAVHTLMLIEVKVTARPRPNLDGISQIRRYRPVLRRRSHGRWEIESYVIAREIKDSVAIKAAGANVTMLEWQDGDPPSLTFRAGRAQPPWLGRLPQ